MSCSPVPYRLRWDGILLWADGLVGLVGLVGPCMGGCMGAWYGAWHFGLALIVWGV